MKTVLDFLEEDCGITFWNPAVLFHPGLLVQGTCADVRNYFHLKVFTFANYEIENLQSFYNLEAEEFDTLRNTFSQLIRPKSQNGVDACVSKEIKEVEVNKIYGNLQKSKLNIQKDLAVTNRN